MPFLGLFGGTYHTCHAILDSQGNFYAINNIGGFNTFPSKFPPEPRQQLLGPEDKEESYRFPGNQASEMAVDRSDDSVFISTGFGAETIQQWDSRGGRVGNAFGGTEPGYEGLLNIGGIAVDPVTNDVWVTNNHEYAGGVRRVERFERVGPFTVPTTDTTDVLRPEGPAKATIRGVLNPDGVPTTGCEFLWGTDQTFSNTPVPCNEGLVHAGTSNITVTGDLIGLTKGTRYWYKLVSKNANGRTSEGGPERFRAQNKPLTGIIFPDAVNTDGVRLNGNVDPNGGLTSYYWEYGETEGYGLKTPLTRLVRRNNQDLEQLPASVNNPYETQDLVVDLKPNTDYHFRLVAENEEGKSVSEDFEFTTYIPDPGTDRCGNALVRQQTTAALLMDCRAYELASTSNGGGYDVVSNVVPGQLPLITSSDAEDTVLYSMDSGVIPGIAGNPTNLGRDPYVATRTSSGWVTRYVGLPAHGMSDEGAYGSPLLGNDDALSTFAFGGADICDPCFPDSSTNIPTRLPDGSLIKGMAGTLNPPADPVGEVRKPISDDGRHLIFGSDQQFDSDGNSGSVSIYDRNLDTNETQVASTMPDGTTMTGTVAELDVSADGERILIGKKVGEDSQGNGSYDLYMHIGTGAGSVEVVNSTSGVIFNGMTDDGSMVYFSTADALAGDGDTSVDLYRADVGSSSAAISRVSTGSGAGDVDTCAPAGTPNSWNVPTGEGKCGVLAFAGGAGLAEDEGSIYFLSPEKLDGNGEADQANLFLAEPGAEPAFVATIDSAAGKAPPAPPTRPVVQPNFGGGFPGAIAVATDQANGDVYVADAAVNKVFRFDSSGAPKNFTAGPGSGTNALPNHEWPEIFSGQVAIDNSPGPSNGNVYVVSQNPAFESKLSVYAPTGALLSTLTGTGVPGGAYGFVCGVSVDQANGDVYLGDFFGKVHRYSPTGNPVAEADYSGGITTGFGSCQTAAAAGRVYVSYEGNLVNRFQASSFAVGPPPAPVGKAIAAQGKGIAADPSSGDLFNAQGNKIAVYDDDEEATPLGTFGTGDVENSGAVAIRSSNQHVFATSNFSQVVEFGYTEVPYTPLNHHAIVNATKQAETHSFGDIQVSDNGDYAIFDSRIPLTGHLNFDNSEIYRYDAGAPALSCPSCAPTKAAATTETFLPAHGLGLTEDGKVFFTTKESFVLRDTNDRLDAYEWVEGEQNPLRGEIQLISRGLGSDDSALLGVTSDGVDAFFFTRDKLVNNDNNGNAVKIYTARVNGGYPFDPDPQACAASDECHGAGTKAPGPPDITSLSPAPVVSPKKGKTCRKGFRLNKRSNKCVKRKKKKAGKGKKASRNHG